MRGTTEHSHTLSRLRQILLRAIASACCPCPARPSCSGSRRASPQHRAPAPGSFHDEPYRLDQHLVCHPKHLPPWLSISMCGPATRLQQHPRPKQGKGTSLNCAVQQQPACSGIERLRWLESRGTISQRGRNSKTRARDPEGSCPGKRRRHRLISEATLPAVCVSRGRPDSRLPLPLLRRCLASRTGWPWSQTHGLSFPPCRSRHPSLLSSKTFFP